MNQKMLESALAALRQSMTDWPAGTVVWHRATGRRGVIDGWKVCGDGAPVISVSEGGGGYTCFPFEISRKKVADNDDGEQWKQELEPPDGTP